MIYVLHTDKAPSIYTLPPDQEGDTLSLLCALIQTDIIEVALDDGEYQIVVDEEGKLKGLEPNIRATALWYMNLGLHKAAARFLLTNEPCRCLSANAGMTDILVGTVVVLTGGNRLT